MSATSTFVPLKVNDEVRAATCKSGIATSELSNSSDSPSEKYSCFGSPLMFTNGSTAIECGGGADADASPGDFAGPAPMVSGVCTEPVTVAGECFVGRDLSIMK